MHILPKYSDDPIDVILQDETEPDLFFLSNSPETKLVSKAINLMDWSKSPKKIYCSLKNLPDRLKGRTMYDIMPVGSVEFVREAMRCLNVVEPDGVGYMFPGRKDLGRKVELMSKGHFEGHVRKGDAYFIKPDKVKQFTGFVLDGEKATVESLEDLAVYDGLPDDTLIWVSEVVDFQIEWRAFVVMTDEGYRVVGFSCYKSDEYEESFGTNIKAAEQLLNIEAEHALTFAEHVVAKLGYIGIAGFSLDVGLCSDGEFRVVEINDGWALGCYDCGYRGYWEVLRKRWGGMG